MKKRIRNIILLFLFITLSATFQNLGMKANIGVCAVWDCLSMNVYELTGLKVGTFGMIMNLSLVGLQIMILRKDFPPIRLLQIPISFVFGFVTNIVYYHIFSMFEIHSYPLRLLCCILSYVGLAFWTAGNTYLNIAQTPTEGTCYVLNKKYGFNFSVLRFLPDFICISLSLILSLVFGLSFKVREGTILGMFILGPMMGYFMEHFWKSRLDPGL